MYKKLEMELLRKKEICHKEMVVVVVVSLRFNKLGKEKKKGRICIMV